LRALVAPHPSITHAPLDVLWQPGPQASAALAAPKVERLAANRTATNRFLMFPPWLSPAPDRPLEEKWGSAADSQFRLPAPVARLAGMRPGDHRPHCSGSGSSLTGSAGGNTLSYVARASRTKRARSSSAFVINRRTSPMCTPRPTFCSGSRCEHHAKHPAPAPRLAAMRAARHGACPRSPAAASPDACEDEEHRFGTWWRTDGSPCQSPAPF
jgi:hypothetical protein